MPERSEAADVIDRMEQSRTEATQIDRVSGGSAGLGPRARTPGRRGCPRIRPDAPRPARRGSRGRHVEGTVSPWPIWRARRSGGVRRRWRRRDLPGGRRASCRGADLGGERRGVAGGHLLQARHVVVGLVDGQAKGPGRRHGRVGRLDPGRARVVGRGAEAGYDDRHEGDDGGGSHGRRRPSPTAIGSPTLRESWATRAGVNELAARSGPAGKGSDRSSSRAARAAASSPRHRAHERTCSSTTARSLGARVPST